MSKEFDREIYQRYKAAILFAIAEVGRVDGKAGGDGVTRVCFAEASMAACHVVAWLAVLNLGEGKVTEDYVQSAVTAVAHSVEREMLRNADTPRPPSLGSLQ